MPTLLPLLKMPVESARSCLGCHWPTVLIAAGKLPPSASPEGEAGHAESGHRKHGRRHAPIKLPASAALSHGRPE